MNGAIMAPQDCVEYAMAVSLPEAPKLFHKNVPSVTNHPPQMKNSKNIIKDNWNFDVLFIINIR